jgi:hypothetical protein
LGLLVRAPTAENALCVGDCVIPAQVLARWRPTEPAEVCGVVSERRDKAGGNRAGVVGTNVRQFHGAGRDQDPPQSDGCVTAFRQVIWPQHRHEFWPHLVQLARFARVAVLLVRSR